MEDKFDIKELQRRISEVKNETKETSEFSKHYFECLIKRHNLADFLDEKQEFQDVPDHIVEMLRNGEVPTEDQLSLMNCETQDFLLKDCVFICGLGAISWYSMSLPEYEDTEEKPFDTIIEMMDISPGHHTACYLIAAFTLLFARIPSVEMIEVLTNNFNSSQEQIEKNLELYNELCVSILDRYLEDKEYYADEE